MTNQERIEAVMRLGYTEREASFLCLAALHSGFFLRRQYCQFIGKEVGGTVAALVEKLVSKGHGTAVAGCQNAHVYHLCARPFYSCIGQEDNRNRRRRTPVVIKNRLMSLDFVLDHSGHHYLATEQEKVDYFKRTWGLSVDDLPRKLFRSPTARVPTARYFMDKYPLFVFGDTAPLASFCFVDEGLQTGARFASFLKEHARLFGRLNQFEVVYVCAPNTPFQSPETTFRRALQAGTPAPSGSVRPAELDGLLVHFEDRQMYESGDLESFDRGRLIRLRDEKRAYSGRLFDDLYSLWQTDGRGAVVRAMVASQSISSANDARFSTCILRHNYDVFGTASTVIS